MDIKTSCFITAEGSKGVSRMQLLRKKGLLDSPRVLFLPVDAISPNPNQPRRVFGTQELEELAGSIQALGLLQPLTVRRRADGWELVAGERRLRAAKLASAGGPHPAPEGPGADPVPAAHRGPDRRLGRSASLPSSPHQNQTHLCGEGCPPFS